MSMCKNGLLTGVLAGMVTSLMSATTVPAETASHTATPSSYNSPSAGLVIHVQSEFRKTPGTILSGLYMNLTLPAGWAVLVDPDGSISPSGLPTPSGIGTPQYGPGGFLFTGSLGTLATTGTRQTVDYYVVVPDGQAGSKQIVEQYGYKVQGAPAYSFITPTPDPFVIIDLTPTIAITSIDGAGASVVVKWSSTTAGTYRVECTPSLHPTVAWSNVPGLGPIPGLQGTTSATDTNAAGPTKFYRVKGSF